MTCPYKKLYFMPNEQKTAKKKSKFICKVFAKIYICIQIYVVYMYCEISLHNHTLRTRYERNKKKVKSKKVYIYFGSVE